MSLNDFTDAYIECALWSSVGDEITDAHSDSDLSNDTRAQMENDCRNFYEAYSHLFTEENCKYRGCSVTEYAGHDFWLTRNGHGCGFWDGDWNEPVATILTNAAKKFRNVNLCVGDDGLIYQM